MILHVAHQAIFLPSFIEMVDNNFSADEHKFWLSGDGACCVGSSKVYVMPRARIKKLWAYLWLAYKMHRSKKIILHSLLNWRVIVVLSLFPWIAKKSHWVIWGADLYVYQKEKKSLKSRALEVLRRRVIKRLAYLVSYVEGDVQLAREWYGAKGEYQKCLMYLSNVYRPLAASELARRGQDLNVLVGNSASPSNEHFEILDKLSVYRQSNIRLYVPLSYGDMSYAKKVEQYGRKIFRKKFMPIFDFMAVDSYRRFLTNIDVAIFNHRRQQAMGNTITLLGAGKTVYLRPEMTHSRMLSELGIKICYLHEFSEICISEEEATRNTEIIKLHFSEKKLLRQWADIFGERDGVSY